jgi:hypothetical protein
MAILEMKVAPFLPWESDDSDSVSPVELKRVKLLGTSADSDTGRPFRKFKDSEHAHG